MAELVDALVSEASEETHGGSSPLGHTKQLFMLKIGLFFKENWIRFLASIAVGLIFMLIYNLVLQSTTDVNIWAMLSSYRDGATIAGFVLFFFGLLIVLAHFGAFDIFNFFFARKKKEDGSKEIYSEYVERKRMEKSHLNLSFLPYLIVGGLYLLFSLIAILTI